MKKILVVVMLVLVLSLSGCGLNDELNDCKENGGYSIKNNTNIYDQCIPKDLFYTQEEVDEMFEEYINQDINTTFSFDKEYEYWLIRIVSRERNGDTYVYEVEEVGDEHYIVTIESEVLLSVNELALGVETSESVFIVDFKNIDVIIPIIEEE